MLMLLLTALRVMIFDPSLIFKSIGMKKRIFSLFALLFSMISICFALPVDKNPPMITISLDQSFTGLVVDDNITVVLTNKTGSEITVSGDRSQVKKLRAVVKKGYLNIWQPGGDKGEMLTVYVPAMLLRHIIVNGGSQISTASTLDNNGLEVIVNGACKLDLRSKGTIDVNGSSDYEFTKG